MMHCAFNIDSKYIQHCAVTLVSLFENNKEEAISIHIIARELTNNDKQILRDLTHRYHQEIFFYEPDMKLLEGFNIRKFSKRISIATYYRCILSAILPETIHKVIYLDCDIVIMDSILPMWETDLNGVGVAAVEDMGCREPERYEVLKYPMEYSYFNAGVLLINLDFWREHNIAQACVDYFHMYPERILYNDQDLLNSVLYKDKILIDIKWNVQDAFYRSASQIFKERKKSHIDALLHPVILHYTNRKPWSYDSQHPLRNKYFYYLDFTPWKGERSLDKPINRIKRFLRLLPFYLKIRKVKYMKLNKINL